MAIENCNIDGSCKGVFEIDDECDGEGKVIKCSSGPRYGSVEVNAKCGGYIKLGKSPGVYNCCSISILRLLRNLLLVY